MENAPLVVSQILRKLNIKFLESEIEDRFDTHPDYPSLLSVYDVLIDLGIDTVGLQIASKDVATLAPPFIAHIADNKFVVVNAVSEENVTVLDEDSKNKILETSRFNETFTGHVLQIDSRPGNASQITQISDVLGRFLFKARIPVITIGILALVFISLLYFTDYFKLLTFQIAATTLVLLLGCVTSVLLLIQSVDSNNPIIKKVCQLGNSNCSYILSSKAAKILWGYLTWAEVGFFYFVGSFLLYAMNSNVTPIVQILAILNLLALPYTFYSIYYQKFVAKQWCFLCLTVQVLLWLGFILLFSFLTIPLQTLYSTDVVLIIISYISPMLLWWFVKPFIVQSRKMFSLKHELKQIKGNVSVFEALIKEKGRYPLLRDEDSLVLGNASSKNIITIVTNPYCGVCEQAQQTLESWLKQYDFLKIQIVFSIDERQNIIDFARHMYNLNLDGGAVSVRNAFEAWHNEDNKDFEAWVSKFPSTVNSNVDQILRRNGRWCSAIGLQFTPTIMINGFKVPAFYDLDEIKYFLINSKIA